MSPRPLPLSFPVGWLHLQAARKRPRDPFTPLHTFIDSFIHREEKENKKRRDERKKPCVDHDTASHPSRSPPLAPRPPLLLLLLLLQFERAPRSLDAAAALLHLPRPPLLLRSSAPAHRAPRHLPSRPRPHRRPFSRSTPHPLSPSTTGALLQPRSLEHHPLPPPLTWFSTLPWMKDPPYRLWKRPLRR